LLKYEMTNTKLAIDHTISRVRFGFDEAASTKKPPIQATIPAAPQTVAMDAQKRAPRNDPRRCGASSSRRAAKSATFKRNQAISNPHSQFSACERPKVVRLSSVTTGTTRSGATFRMATIVKPRKLKATATEKSVSRKIFQPPSDASASKMSFGTTMRCSLCGDQKSPK